MKLIEFNEISAPGRAFIAPSITITLGNGRILLNASAVRILGLNYPKDRVAIAQDQDDPVNWYIFKDEKGYLFKSARADSQGMRLQHKDLCRKIIVEFLERDGSETHRFRIATIPVRAEGKVLYGILF